MDFKKFQTEAKRTCAQLGDLSDNIHMTLGMVTETAELADCFKKRLAYNKPVDWVNVKEELGDLMWYIANFCTMHGIDIEEIMETNIAKLKARYPDKFTEEKAIHRDLNKEREILEK